MRFVDAESQGAERRREIGGVETMLGFRHQLVIVQILEHEQACRIRFRLFNCRMKFLERLPDAVLRSDAVGHLMRQDMREKRVEIEIALSFGGKHAARDRFQTF